MVRGLLIVFQALLWLLLLRLLLRTLAGFFARPGGGQAAPRQAPRVKAAEDLVLDRVCRTHVPRSLALVARVEGHEEHFCSTACRDRALAAVARAS